MWATLVDRFETPFILALLVLSLALHLGTSASVPVSACALRPSNLLNGSGANAPQYG
jgi:hypothetical protein